MMKKFTRYLVLLLAVIACWQFSSGGYIYAKAILAQYLLDDAWEETLITQSQVKPWSWADTWPVARLQFEQYGVNQIILEGSTGPSLAFAPGHMEGTVMPGELGVSVIGGHRDTHFEFLEDVKVGDEFTIDNAQGINTQFKIISTEVVDSRTSAIRLSSNNQQVLLVTCYPFNALQAGGPLRYVVTAVKI